MALLHNAELRPSKLELLSGWLPTRPWYEGPAEPEVTRVAAFRFDDPDGEVGIETMLVQVDGGPVLQVPLTYRGAPLDGAEEHLIGTMDHSVLGPRWVYDACGDAVYARALAEVIATGGHQAEEVIEIDGELRMRPANTLVQGSGAPVAAVNEVVRVEGGDPSVIVTDGAELVIPRRPDSAELAGTGQLTGTWKTQDTPVLLAYVR